MAKRKVAKDEPILAVEGLAGWYVHGRCAHGTFRAGPYYETPTQCPYLVSMRAVHAATDLGDAAKAIWKRPNLDLGLPNNNVRNLFEGCIGNAGTTDGHAWDGKLESLQSMDSVGLKVYLAILRASGAEMIKG